MPRGVMPRLVPGTHAFEPKTGTVRVPAAFHLFLRVWRQSPGGRMTSPRKEGSPSRSPARNAVGVDERRPQPRREPPDELFEEKGPPGGCGGAGPEEDES